MKSFKEYITENSTIIDNVEFTMSKHFHDRIQERSLYSKEDLHQLLTLIRKKLASLPIKGEFLFYSNSMKQGIIADWNAYNQKVKLITFLPKGEVFSKSGTDKIVMESYKEYTIIFI